MPSASFNLGTHDVGGLRGSNLELTQQEHTGKLRDQDREYQHWEKQVHATLVLLIKKGLFSADELRAGVEQLEPRLVMDLSYYEKWTMSMILGLIRRNVVTREEIEQIFLEWKLDDEQERTENNKQVFSVGDKVVVKPEAVHRRWRRPHLRIPGYIHGVCGEITEVIGKFWDPAYTAFCDHIQHQHQNSSSNTTTIVREELKQPLYRVKFRFSDIKHYAPDTYQRLEQKKQPGVVSHNDNDFIYLDVFHPWLRRVVNNDNKDLELLNDPNKKFHSAPLKRTNEKHDHGDGSAPHYHGTRCDIEVNALNKEKLFPLQNLAEGFIHLLVSKKKILTKDAIRQVVQKLDGNGNPAARILNGQRIVARAWVDPDFKQLLKTNPTEACKKLGIQASNYTTDISTHPHQKKNKKEDAFLRDFAHGHTELRAVEDTDEVKNLICCTLCSCYAASLLGTSPDWYKSRNYRSRCVADPRGLLRDEFGLDLPRHVQLHVHDSTAEVRYIVIPQRPRGTEGWSESELMKIITRDSMIGVEKLKDVVGTNSKL